MLSRRQTLMALAAGFASQAYAQRSTTDYPTKPIKIIVPFPAGGGGDILARLTLSKLAQELGQSIVFENIGGAGGNVGVSTGSLSLGFQKLPLCWLYDLACKSSP